MTLTAKSFGLDVTAPFTVKHDLIEGTTLYGNVTEAFRVWGDSSTGSANGDHVHIVDDKGNVLVLTMDQFEDIRRLDLSARGPSGVVDRMAAADNPYPAIAASDSNHEMAVEAFTADEELSIEMDDRFQAHEETVLEKAKEGGPLRIS